MRAEPNGFRPVGRTWRLSLRGKLSVLILGVLPWAAASADAADWTTELSISEALEVVENRTLSSDSPGISIGSETVPAINITGTTQRLTFNLGGALSYQAFTGEAEDDISGDSTSFSQRVGTGLLWSWLHGAAGLDAQYSRRDARATELEDTGRVEIDTTREEFQISPNLQLQPTRFDQFSFDTNYQNVDFTDDSPALRAFEAWSGNIGWSRRLTRLSTGTLTVGYTNFDPDSRLDTESETVSGQIGFGTQVNQRLSLNVAGGLSYTEFEEGRPSGTTRSEDNVGFVGSLGMAYAGEVSTFNLELQQSVQPSAVGSVVQRTALVGAYDQDINERTTFFVGAVGQFDNRRDPFASGADAQDRYYFRIEPGLRWRLLPEVFISGSYSFRYQDTDDSATSNGVFLKITYQDAL